MARALGVHELMNKKYKTLDFDGKWAESFGLPEDNFRCIIYGNSGHGKTEFTIQLCKYLTRFGKVAYNSLEQGDSKSLQDAFIRQNMQDVKGKIVLIDRERIPDLVKRLKRRKSPKIVVIDSIQYAAMKYEDHQLLKETFKRKIFIYISHAEGKEPHGGAAKQIKYDVDVKIFVSDFKAYVRSRFGGHKPFVIWDKAPAPVPETPNLFNQ
jgi:KaiC/GvpD/RAD55 family RecA-like ATPase